MRFALISDQVLNTRIKCNDRVKSSKVCENLIKEAETLRAKHKRGDGVSQASNAPQYRGSNQLLFLQSANSSTWLNNPPVLFDFKKTKWKAVRGPSGACRYREGTSHVYNEGTIYSLGGEYARDTHHPGAEFGAPGPAFQHLAVPITSFRCNSYKHEIFRKIATIVYDLYSYITLQPKSCTSSLTTSNG